MTEDRQAYISYRLDRAREALDEATVLWNTAHYNAYVNRLYYACFYAVNALLLAEKLKASTHSGVRHLFSRNFIKTHTFDRELADIYFELFHYRHRADYEDAFRIDPEIAGRWLERVKTFVNTIAQRISAST